VIISRLVDGGWLIEKSTFKSDNLRSAGYDLRIDVARLRIQDPDDPTRFKEYNEANPYHGNTFDLQPGQVAFVTTKERLCLPWTVAGNIGIRNRFALRGLVVFTGLLVDPGFGREERSGRWKKAPRPLHFGIMNIGDRRETVVVGETLAAIQFLKVAGPAEKRAVDGLGDSDPIARGFALLPEVAALRERMAEEAKKRAEEDVALLQKIDGVEKQVTNVVVFGVFVVAATLFAAVLAILLEAIGNTQLFTNFIALTESHRTAAILLTVVFVALLLTVAGAAWKAAVGMGMKADRMKKKATGSPNAQDRQGKST
jgi:deoxycytidine triphosphate deaminase